MEDEENEQSNSEKNEDVSNGIENEEKGDKKSRLGILQKLKQNSDKSDDTVFPSKKTNEKESIMKKLLEAKRKKEKVQQEYEKKMNNNTKEEDDNNVKNERERLRTRREENDEERHKSKSIAKANPNLQNKLRQLFQNRIVQVETSPEEKEEDDEADKDLDPELRREKMEKNQIKQKLLKIAMEKKKKQEKEERRLRKLQREQEEEDNDDDNNEESKSNTEDNNEYKEEKKDKGGFRSILEQIKQKKSQKEALQRSFEQPAMNSKEESKKDEETDEEKRERERILEMVRKQEEKFKREEEARLAEEKRKEEIKRQEEEKKKEEFRKLKEEIKRKEELKRQEEERIRLEKKKAEEEEKKRLMEIQKEEERKLREKLEEERIQREKEKKEEEERIRKEEERKRQIELEREEEERKQKEEEERLREKFKREEMERIERLKKEAEEKERQEKLRKEQEERERLEKLKKEEEERLKEELRKKEEEERLLQEQLRKQEEEEERIRQEKLKKQEEERKRKEEEEKKRKEEEDRRRKEEEEEKKRKAILAEQERKKKELEDLKRQADEERLSQLKKDEEARKLKEKLEDDTPLSKDADYLQQRYQQSEEYKRTKFSHQQPLSYNKFHFNPPKLQPEQSFEQYQTNTTTYQKPYQKKQNIIYNPKKPSIRGRSVEKVQNAHTNLNNTQMYSSPKNYSEYPSSNNLYDISSIKTNEPYTKSPSRYTKNTQFFAPNMPSLSSRQVNPFHYNDYFYEQNQHMAPPSPLYNNNSNESLSINLEDLMILEEKLNDIISNFITNKIMTNECFEWWNYYFNCSLFNKIEKAFKDESSHEVVQTSINYELLSIIIAYDVSFDKSLLDQIYVMLKPALYSNHHNLIIICEYILSKVSSESLNNLWVLKLRNLVNSVKNSKNSDLNPNGQFGLVDMSLTEIDKIRYNTNSISSSIRIILKNYPHSTKTNGLINLYKNITKHSYEEINDFFQSNIMRVENPNASVLASVVLRENGSFSTVDPPYLKTKNLKQYTLVLDLDETILHFKINPETENEGVLKVRPGIHEFLETLGKMYEIVVFTAATKEYADILIDEVEENRIYFDFRLYRQHTVIINNDFVKDLTRLGRPLDKVIIVDNMPQNFRLQKENGINIRAFWGEDQNDTALIELLPILMKIAMEGGDVRKGLAKYKDEIVKKVTMNVSKYN